MTARSISITRNTTSASTFAHQTWVVAFATDVVFTSYVADVFASDTYTLTIDGVTVETKAVTGPSTGTIFTPGSPMALSAGAHTFALTPTGSQKFYYFNAFPTPLSGDIEYGVWGSWSLSTANSPAGQINFNDTAGQLTAGMERNGSTASSFSGSTWNVTFDEPVSVMSFCYQFRIADTYNLKINGTTVATVVASAGQTGAFIPSLPVHLASGTHAFKLEPTASRTWWHRTSATPLVGSSHLTTWAVWSEAGGTTRVPGRMGFIPDVTGGTLALSMPVPRLALGGTYRDVGTLALTLPVPQIALSGNYTPPTTPVGDLAVTLPVPTLALAGDYIPRETGSFDLTLPVPTLDLAGDYSVPVPVGSLDGVIPTAEGSLNGFYQNATIEGALDGVLPGGLQAGLQGRYRGQISTDTTNGVDGRSRGGGAVLEFEPPVAATPAGAFEPEGVVKAMAFPFPTIVNGEPTWDQNDLVVLETSQAQDLVQVGGKYVTGWRMTEPDHQPTKVPSYELTEPFAYGPSGDLFIPRIAGFFERPGHGDLYWVKKWATVQYKRRTPTGRLVDYRGVVVGIKPAADGLYLSVAGDLSGRLAAMLRPAPPARRVQDIGQFASYLLGLVHKKITPRRGPVTGIEIPDGGGSGMTQEAWGANLCQMSQTRSGARRVLMPNIHGKDLWELRFQDLTTVHYTAFLDGDWVGADLFDDAMEQPNRYYGSGITPSGTRWRNTVFPTYIQGDPPDYPISGGDPFGIGTTDADTIHGDGISVLWLKLRSLALIPWTVAYPDVYDQRVADIVEDIQDAAGLEETGIIDPATWNAIYNLEVTGYHHGGRVEPLIQDPAIPNWLTSSNGSVIGRNPKYDRKVQPVDRIIDFDSGVTKDQARNWIRGERKRTNAKNYAGTITINYGVWAGRVNDENISGLTEDDIVAPTHMRAGKNIWLPHFEGGTLFHIAKISMSEDRQTATLTVDTQGRDYLELKAIMARNREARRSLRRAWLASNQPGRQTGNLVIHDEHFGILDEDKVLDGLAWNVFPVAVGQMGTIQKLYFRTKNRPAMYCLAFFTNKPTRHQLQAQLGNPLKLNADGENVWEQQKNKAFFDKYVRLYVAGTPQQPCGFGEYKGFFSDGSRTSHPLTGEHLDTATWPYLADSENDPFIWCAMYPDRSTTVEAGQRLFVLEDDVT